MPDSRSMVRAASVWRAGVPPNGPRPHARAVDQLADGHAEDRRRYQGDRQHGDVGPGQSFLDGHENHSSLIVRLIIPQNAAAVVK